MIKSKGYTSSFYGKQCMGCYRREQCMTAGSVRDQPRKYVLRILRKKYRQNEAMRAGKRRHEEVQKGIKTVSDHDPLFLKKDIQDGKRVTLQEVPVCSSKYGFRGVVDLLELEYKDGAMNVRAIELKSGFYKGYISQIMVYGLILSDKKVRAYSDDRKEYFYLYPNENFELDINLNLKILKSGQEMDWHFMRDGKMTDKCKGMSFGVIKRANNLRIYHSPQIIDPGEFPKCDGCRENWCGYWHICKVFQDVELPEIKRQRYLGKRNLLVKTKPKVIKNGTVRNRRS